MRDVVVELHHTTWLERQSATEPVPGFGLDLRSLPHLPSLEVDRTFAPVPVPDTQQAQRSSERTDDGTTAAGDGAPTSTYLIRGGVEDDDVDTLLTECVRSPRVVGVYADPAIAPLPICLGAPAQGTSALVASLLCADSLHRRGLDGRGVHVAIVDTGINARYLQARGLMPLVDVADSWAWDPRQVTPGDAAVGHGTMVAFDVMIAAPRATLVDVALLHPVSAPPGGSLVEGLLSDATRAYAHLIAVARRSRPPEARRSLVVNNSWGMFNPSWDFPPADPRNYSDNAAHPFNRIVANLERAGADIVFAAGNCGSDCPDRRCGGVTDRTIYGANGHPAVLTVAGVDTTAARVGYSSTGPGRLHDRKPDIAGYTHFSGSGVHAVDGGTSAAAPVVSGVVAALRSRLPYDPDDPATLPAAMRAMLAATASDVPPPGFDHETGHGVIDACRAADLVAPASATARAGRPVDSWHAGP